MTPKNIYGQDVQRLNISLPPRYVRELDALAEHWTEGKRSAMIRLLIEYRLQMENRGHYARLRQDAPTRPA